MATKVDGIERALTAQVGLVLKVTEIYLRSLTVSAGRRNAFARQ